MPVLTSKSIVRQDADRSLKDDVLKNGEEKCTVGGEMQIAALAAAVSLPVAFRLKVKELTHQYVMDKSNSVATVGAVGDDYAKTVCLNAMKEAGIAPRYKVIENDGTGFRITYDGRDMRGNPTCCRITVPRAGTAYTLEDLKNEEVSATIEKTSWLYLDAGSWNALEDRLIDLAELVIRGGQRYVLNLSATDFLLNAGPNPSMSRLMSLAYVVVLTEDTARRFHGRHNHSGKEDSWEEGAKMLASAPLYHLFGRPVQYGGPGSDELNRVMVTRGPKDVAIVEGNQEVDPKIRYVKLPPAEEPQPEGASGWEGNAVRTPGDRHGVGELFAGGFVAGLAKGQTLEEAVLTGHKLAAYSLTQEGPKLPPKDNAANAA